MVFSKTLMDSTGNSLMMIDGAGGAGGVADVCGLTKEYCWYRRTEVYVTCASACCCELFVEGMFVDGKEENSMILETVLTC